MCNYANNNQDCKCIAEILTTINILQDNAECNDSCLDTCDRGFLGCSITPIRCNTRPIMLYTGCGNGLAWSMPITRENLSAGDDGPRSNVFRVEKIDGCCCTCRVLVPNCDPQDDADFIATNTFFTINLSCICCIRCLDDTYVCL